MKSAPIWLLLIILLTVITGSFYLTYLARPLEEALDTAGVGERFHRDTSLTWDSVLKKVFWRVGTKKVPLYKSYPDAPMIALPEPRHQGISVEDAIHSRRSRRNYASRPITKEQLSQVLFAAGGLTNDSRRAAPSAGATYPIETYVIIHSVDGIAPGIYHYAVREHALALIREGDFRSQSIRAAQEQSMAGSAGAVFVLSAIFDRVGRKYGERGYRYSYLEAGHISQNIYLQAESLGLGSVCLGGFLDYQINDLLGLDGVSEAVLYLQTVGTL